MDHDHEKLKPQLISTWMPNGVGAMPGKRVIFAETQVSSYFSLSLSLSLHALLTLLALLLVPLMPLLISGPGSSWTRRSFN